LNFGTVFLDYLEYEMPRIFSILTIILFFFITAFAQTHPLGTPSEQNPMLMPCSDCHICPQPTIDYPCLKRCPRHDWNIKSEHHPEEGPDTVMIDELENLYGPVEFEHKQHAHMSEMEKGCAECHHYTPPGKIEPCSDCHSKEPNPKYLRQPGLKGAYHQHCMRCHEDWSLSIYCNFCHVRKAVSGGGALTAADSIAMTPAPRPSLSEPDTKVYHTDMTEGPIVTFHHKQHITLFGLQCVNCHSGQSCGSCHTPEDKRVATETVPHEPHSRCFTCHENASCDKCHKLQETKGFSHAETGWALNRFHQPLSCNACHPSGQKIEKLDPNCTSCHKNWNSKTFNHNEITGVVLGDTHKELDCSDCHLNKRFDQKPSCASCHDDGRSYPQSKPGT
jgi:hypothetical protein